MNGIPPWTGFGVQGCLLGEGAHTALRRRSVEEDLGALDLWLSEEAFARVEAIFAPGAIRGPRYSAPLQAQIDTETFPDEELA